MSIQSRSQLTLTAIVDTALSMAASDGLESLTIGEVAKRLGLSKSGVFSRVGSREQLQGLVLEEYDRRFVQDVLVPALREPRGLPRLNALMQRWLERAQRVEVRGLKALRGVERDDDGADLRVRREAAQFRLERRAERGRRDVGRSEDGQQDKG